MSDISDAKARLRAKYDTSAPRYTQHYANPQLVAQRQVDYLKGWGTPLDRGATVLEIGCANGLVTEALARAGFEVTAIDLSPNMIHHARERLARAGLEARFEVGDADSVGSAEHRGTAIGDDARFDAVLGVMGNFFAYLDDPGGVLRRIARIARCKVVVDTNPRQVPVAEAVRGVEEAGFRSVAWKALLVPRRFAVNRVQNRLLQTLEATPLIRGLMIRRFGRAVVLGDHSL